RRNVSPSRAIRSIRLLAHQPDRCSLPRWRAGPSPSAWAFSTGKPSRSATCSSGTASSICASARRCRRPAVAVCGSRSCVPAWPRTRNSRPWPTLATTLAPASSAWVSCRSPAAPSVTADLRAELVGGGGRLEGLHDGQERVFVVGGAAKLGADREAFGGAADGKGERGKSGFVDGDGQP